MKRVAFFPGLYDYEVQKEIDHEQAKLDKYEARLEQLRSLRDYIRQGAATARAVSRSRYQQMDRGPPIMRFNSQEMELDDMRHQQKRMRGEISP
jgi:hypothetical protein